MCGKTKSDECCVEIKKLESIGNTYSREDGRKQMVWIYIEKICRLCGNENILDREKSNNQREKDCKRCYKKDHEINDLYRNIILDKIL